MGRTWLQSPTAIVDPNASGATPELAYVVVFVSLPYHYITGDFRLPPSSQTLNAASHTAIIPSRIRHASSPRPAIFLPLSRSSHVPSQTFASTLRSSASSVFFSL